MIFTPEVWIMGASAVVAVCALAVTVWEGFQARKHNKLSVRPLLTSAENSDITRRGMFFSWELINAGLGPAIIKDFIVLFNGKEVSRNNREELIAFLKKKTKKYGDLKVFTFRVDSSMVANEKCEILSFTYNPDQDISFIEKLDLRINYQSIYKDKTFTYDTRKSRILQGVRRERPPIIHRLFRW